MNIDNLRLIKLFMKKIMKTYLKYHLKSIKLVAFANAGTVGASLISVISLFQRRIAHGKNAYVVFCFLGNKEFVVSCICKMTMIDMDLFVMYFV